MNKPSNIFFVIIIVLLIALTISTYYAFYYRKGYLNAVNETQRILNQAGGSITTTYQDNGTTTNFGENLE